MRGKFLLLFVSLILSLVSGEMIFRALHYRPGIFCYYDNLPSDTKIFEYPQLQTDVDGINRVRPDVRALFLAHMQDKDDTRDSLFIGNEIKALWWERRESELKPPDNEFYHYHQQASRKRASERTEHENAVLDFYEHPINSDGFRSIEFKNYRQKGLKILLLGDSFTWGYSAEPLSGSFADTLLARGHFVFNTGLGGMDSAQYLHVARKYIPLLRPDIVIVNFFMGNDPSVYDRTPQPGIPLLFHTNVGPLYSFGDGTYFKTPREVYDFIFRRCRIPPTSFFNRTMALTALTSALWTELAERNQWSTRHPEDIALDKIRLPVFDPPYSDRQMAEIKDIAKKNHSRFILSIIPLFQNGQVQPVPDSTFKGLDYHVPALLTSDYARDNMHFNSVGHFKYAEFLDKLILDSKAR